VVDYWGDFDVTIIDKCDCAHSSLLAPSAPLGDISIGLDNVMQDTSADLFTDSVSENTACTPCTAPRTYTLVYSADDSPVPTDLAAGVFFDAMGTISVLAQTTNAAYLGDHLVKIQGSVDFTGSNPQTAFSPPFTISVIS